MPAIRKNNVTIEVIEKPKASFLENLKNLKWDGLRKSIMDFPVGTNECLKVGPFEEKRFCIQTFQLCWKGHRPYKNALELPPIAEKEGWTLTYRIEKYDDGFYLLIAKLHQDATKEQGE